MTERELTKKQLAEILVQSLKALYVQDFKQLRDNLEAIDILTKHFLHLQETSNGR